MDNTTSTTWATMRRATTWIPQLIQAHVMGVTRASYPWTTPLELFQIYQIMGSGWYTKFFFFFNTIWLQTCFMPQAPTTNRKMSFIAHNRAHVIYVLVVGAQSFKHVWNKHFPLFFYYLFLTLTIYYIPFLNFLQSNSILIKNSSP